MFSAFNTILFENINILSSSYLSQTDVLHNVALCYCVDYYSSTLQKVQNSTGYDSPEEMFRDRDKGQSSNSPGQPSSSVFPPSLYNDSPGSLDSFNTRGSPAGVFGTGLNRQDLREVNFQYLRHVVFKFMSSSDQEVSQ